MNPLTACPRTRPPPRDFTPHWHVLLHVAPVLESFPRPAYMAEETVRSPDYGWQGRTRRGENHCVFQYSLEGCGRFRLGRRTHRVPAGTGFLCQVNDPRIAYWHDAAEAGPWHFLFFSFTQAEAAVRELLDRFGPLYTLPPDSAAIREILRFRRYSGTAVDLSPGEGAALVMGFLAQLADAALNRADTTAGHALAAEARRLIQGRLETRYSVAALARDLGVSPSHLARVFRLQTGRSPRDVLAREKIRLACRLLRETPLAVKQVLAQLGYDTASHFARSFRRFTGLTPRAFRRQKRWLPL